MRIEEVKKRIKALFPELGDETLHDFLSRMDRDYSSIYPPFEIGTHIVMANRLDPDHPVMLKATPKGDRMFDVIVVAFDYFSEFSILCGLLASFGLNIRAGNSHTFSDKKVRGVSLPPPDRTRARFDRRDLRKKVVDLFQVISPDEKMFDPENRKKFEEELQGLIRLLDQGLFIEARERVNRRLIESLAKAGGPVGDLLHPVEVRFDNRRSRQWTLLDIRGKESPGFLYALSNALSMRGIYIHKVIIKNSGQEVQDQLYVSDRRGRKIRGEKEKRTLRMSVALIKQFTRFLTRAADPAKAIAAFDQLLDKIIEEERTRPLISFLENHQNLNVLAQLFGASDFLWEDFLRIQFENLLPILEAFKKREFRPSKGVIRLDLRRHLRQAVTFEDQKRVLNEYKDREMFRIDMRHLLEPTGIFTDFSQALSDLAEVVVDQAYQICHADLTRQYGLPRMQDGTECPFTICALGKFGGRELGYASDIELLFVYGGPGQTVGREIIENRVYFEKLSQQITHFIKAKQEGIFHIDTRLRPYGSAGMLAIPLEQLMAYYSPRGEAAPFERQALIKLRWVAGDRSLGRKVEMYRDRFVYSSAPWDLKTALTLRERQIAELVPPGKVNVKYSAGGILDVEYTVQYLQIIHGGRHPNLRTSNTIKALDQLYELRIISKQNWIHLYEAYFFLRRLIDALRIVRGHAKDLILPELHSDEFTFLARRMGYGQRDWKKGRSQLESEIQRHMRSAHQVFQGCFPLSRWPI